MLPFTQDPLMTRFPFGRKTQLRRRYDWDAQMYFNRVQAAGTELSVEEKSNVSSLIRGLKNLGAFWPMIDGWLLRSTQNVGTGTLVPGIKSIAGTLVNGPTWGVNGMTFAGANRSLNTSSIGLPKAPVSLLAIGGINWATTFVNYVFMGSPGNPERTFAIQCNVGGGDRGLASSVNFVGAVNYTPDTTVPTGGLGVWQFHQQTATTGTGNINGTEVATTAFKNWNVDGVAGTLVPASNGGPDTLQLAFVGFFAMDTRPLSAHLRALVKDTIGKGLNLP